MSRRKDLPMTPIADRWFERRRVDDDITLLWEPHVDRLIRCNIWHVRGRDCDLLVDTGLGIVSLAEAARDLLGKPVVAVATHTHYDHVGGLHEFATRLVHQAEAAAMADFTAFATLQTADLDPAMLAGLRAAGLAQAAELVTAYPHAGFDVGGFRIRSAAPTRIVDEGDAIDLGDRRFEVLHLPGHSPGSLGLWEAASGTLFSGDAIYDGVLIDDLPTSDVADYIRTMRRLRELPVRAVHGGHRPSFGRERLIAIVDDYLRRKGAG
jgi:glyoxylase-like metal-dependent hydrolase (beta-lactamase superfamily II)